MQQRRRCVLRGKRHQAQAGKGQTEASWGEAEVNGGQTEEDYTALKVVGGHLPASASATMGANQ
jgi:hypothetical protein